jgi:hypothetical protein
MTDQAEQEVEAVRSRQAEKRTPNANIFTANDE